MSCYTDLYLTIWYITKKSEIYKQNCEKKLELYFIQWQKKSFKANLLCFEKKPKSNLNQTYFDHKI